jgi:hypothetical protein
MKIEMQIEKDDIKSLQKMRDYFETCNYEGEFDCVNECITLNFLLRQITNRGGGNMENITCPHCKHKFTDTEMYPVHEEFETLPFEENTFNFECPGCKKELFIAGEQIPAYKVFRNIEERMGRR